MHNNFQKMLQGLSWTKKKKKIFGCRLIFLSLFIYKEMYSHKMNPNITSLIQAAKSCSRA